MLWRPPTRFSVLRSQLQTIKYTETLVPGSERFKVKKGGGGGGGGKQGTTTSIMQLEYIAKAKEKKKS